MVKKTESADTLLLGKEIERMKKEMEEIKFWQNKILTKIDDIEKNFTDTISEINEKNDKRYAKKEDVDILKKSLIWVVGLIIWGVITALLAKIWL